MKKIVLIVPMSLSPSAPQPPQERADSLVGLTSADFEKLMADLALPQTAPRFAVAVSGGPDSMALTLFLHEWVKARQGTLKAFTVDHRLRNDSTKEAKQVGAWLQPHGINHAILTWAHENAPASAIHARARMARYDLLLSACRAENYTHLFLAQHADDQAETVLMRFAKGSGLDGLAGMASLREQDDITLVRPLLPIRKSSLEGACAAHNWPYVIDPSNQSPRFTRARLRALQPELAQEGLTTERLYEIARASGQNRAQLEGLANQWLQTHAKADAFGRITFSYSAWCAESEAMRLRLLARALLCAGGQDYAPRLAALERLHEKLLHKVQTIHTLSGCMIEVDENTIFFMREEGLVDETLALNATAPFVRWDNRFVFTPAEGAQNTICIKKLGAISRDQLEKRGFTEIAALPAKLRASLPALYINAEWIDLPDFGANPQKNRVCTSRFLPRRSLILKPFSFCPPLLH